jgi:hypothetical protein
MLLALLLACTGDETVITGSVDGESLELPGTVFWGGPFVVFMDESLGCFDVDWVRRTYDAGTSPSESDVVALQFGFDDDTPQQGVSSVGGTDSIADAKMVIVRGGAFTEIRDRDGTITIDTMEPQGDMEGSFSVNFGDSGSLETSYFYAEYCNNLVRN